MASKRVASVLLIAAVLMSGSAVGVMAFPKCLICTLLTGIIEQVALDTQLPVSTAIDNLCTDVTKDLPFLDGVCEIAGGVVFASTVQSCVNNGVSPDNCCKQLKWCDDNSPCTLFKEWPPKVPLTQRHLGPQLLELAQGADFNAMPKAQSLELVRAFSGVAAYLGLGAMDKNERRGVSPAHGKHHAPAPVHRHSGKVNAGDTPIPVADHLPLFDDDGDRFSPYGALRGYHWRGMDCNDKDKSVYPGRQATTYGPEVDHNCNGIYGSNAQGESYEDVLCKGTGQRGIISLGDSVTAHFRIPDYMLRPAYINASTYENLIPLVEDEADWPLCSWGTGFANASSCPYSKLGVDSLALKLRANNLCNHRDFQNAGVNGARVGSMAPPGGIVTTIHNRTGTDQPAVVIYALVGNDVCNGHPDFSRMTTPADFEASVVAALEYLDAALAPNSYVIFVGLADGRILFDTLQNETHPIGVPYPDFYDYLNCYETSPCWGWMNTNTTVRDITWNEHANVLNNIYPKIISERSYDNFEMFYVPPDFQRIIDAWLAMGGHARELIEPVDGFHPSQTGNVLLAQQIWADLKANFSQAIGPENPNNAQITALFGDQGGYGPV